MLIRDTCIKIPRTPSGAYAIYLLDRYKQRTLLGFVRRTADKRAWVAFCQDFNGVSFVAETRRLALDQFIADYLEGKKQ